MDGRNSPDAAYATPTPYRVVTLVPSTAVIAYQVLPETAVTQVVDHDSPGTVAATVTMVPVGMVTSVVADADVEGDARRRVEQLAT